MPGVSLEVRAAQRVAGAALSHVHLRGAGKRPSRPARAATKPTGRAGIGAKRGVLRAQRGVLRAERVHRCLHGARRTDRFGDRKSRDFSEKASSDEATREVLFTVCRLPTLPTSLDLTRDGLVAATTEKDGSFDLIRPRGAPTRETGRHEGEHRPLEAVVEPAMEARDLPSRGGQSLCAVLVRDRRGECVRRSSRRRPPRLVGGRPRLRRDARAGARGGGTGDVPGHEELRRVRERHRGNHQQGPLGVGFCLERSERAPSATRARLVAAGSQNKKRFAAHDRHEARLRARNTAGTWNDGDVRHERRRPPQHRRAQDESQTRRGRESRESRRTRRVRRRSARRRRRGRAERRGVRVAGGRVGGEQTQDIRRAHARARGHGATASVRPTPPTRYARRAILARRRRAICFFSCTFRAPPGARSTSVT